jgi:hypothetical protein
VRRSTVGDADRTQCGAVKWTASICTMERAESRGAVARGRADALACLSLRYLGVIECFDECHPHRWCVDGSIALAEESHAEEDLRC